MPIQCATSKGIPLTMLAKVAIGPSINRNGIEQRLPKARPKEPDKTAQKSGDCLCLKTIVINIRIVQT